MAQGRLKIRFNHQLRTATFSMVDSEDEVLIDYKGQLLENMQYDYSKLEMYKDFHELKSDDGVIGIYYFPKVGT